MYSTKTYIIIAVVCLIIIGLIIGAMFAFNKPVDAQNDILGGTEIIETTEPVIEEAVQEPTIKKTEPTVPEATEPDVEEDTYTEPTVVEETKPAPKPTTKPTEPPVKETKPAPKPTEPPVEEETEPDTEPPVEEETEQPTEPEPETAEPPVEEETETAVNSDELEMLACVIYQEAGSDAICNECRYRVADVVLNRVADSRFPNSIYGVLTQKNQYGSFYWTGVVWPSRASNSGEKNAVNRAYAVAEDVLNGNHSALYGNGYVWQAGFIQGSDNVYCCGHYYGR